MQPNTIAVILVIFLSGGCAGYIIAMHVVENTINTNTETISEQQYYQASLQYLEDIRNSNDAIIDQQEYLSSLHCK